MKMSRESVVRTALDLLNRIGLEQLTLRELARELNIQAPTLYYYFKSKEDLTDSMATMVLVEGASQLLPRRRASGWKAWAASFGTGLRRTLLRYRDGARVVSGSRLRDQEYMGTAERVAAKLVEQGFSVRQTVILLSTIYTFTVSFVLEEQAVFPRPGERSPAYDLVARNASLDPEVFPILRKGGDILFSRFDQRYTESLQLILRGAENDVSARQ